MFIFPFLLNMLIAIELIVDLSLLCERVLSFVDVN